MNEFARVAIRMNCSGTLILVRSNSGASGGTFETVRTSRPFGRPIGRPSLTSFWDFQKLSFVFAPLGITVCALLTCFRFIWGFQKLSFVFVPPGIAFCALSFLVFCHMYRHMHMYVHMYIHIYIHMYIHMYIHIHFLIIFTSLWGHLWVDTLGVILGSFWGCFGITLGSIWDHSGHILASPGRQPGRRGGESRFIFYFFPNHNLPFSNQNKKKMASSRFRAGGATLRARMTPEWSQNDPRLTPKWSQNNSKWTQNDPKVFPK